MLEGSIMRVGWTWVVLVVVSGCAVPGVNAQVVGAMGLGPKPGEPDAPAHDDSTADGHLANLVDRAKAARQMADEAVRLDGTAQASGAQNLYLSCTFLDRKVCAQQWWGVAGHQSKVGELAGLASYLTSHIGTVQYAVANGGRSPTDPQPLFRAGEDVAEAEGAAKEAMEEAHKVAAVHAEKQSKDQGDDALIKSAMEACGANPTDCKPKCDAGDNAYCVAWGWRLWKSTTPPKLTEAKEAIGKACLAGMRGACLVAAPLVAEVQAANSKIEQLWGAVQGAADDIAGKSHAVEWALRVSPTSQTQVAMGRMRKVAAATVVEKYCPAKSDFIAATSPAEFTRRAEAHCQNDPPSGNEGPLPVQCRAAFAEACPAAQPRRQPPPDDPVNTSPAWRAVQQAGDALATTRHTLRVTVDLNPTTRNVEEAEKYRRYEPTIMARGYCPAKKAFVAQFSASEFAKRAAAHCQGDPPMTAGLSGAQVPLPSDCRDVFALSCP